MIISNRLGPPGHRRAIVVLEFLGAVNRGAVHQHVVLAVRRHHDLVNAEETAHGFDAAVVGRIGPDQHQRHHDRRENLPAIGVQSERQQGREHADSTDHPDPVFVKPGHHLALRISGRDQYDRERGEKRPVPAAPTQQSLAAAGRAAQRRQRQQDRVFRDPRKRKGRDQAREQAADHAAERQRDIKAGEIFRRRASARQLAVARHRNDKKAKLVSAKRQQQILFATDRKQYDHACDRQRLRHQHPFVRQQRARLEHQHPGQEIERQRQHPQ